MSQAHEYTLSDAQARTLEEFMRSKRISAGFSRQSDAANAIGVSQDLISRLESRFTPNIRLAEFGRVLQAYGIAPNEAYEILGLYDSQDWPSPEKRYIEREVLPVLFTISLEQLKIIKRVAESLK